MEEKEEYAKRIQQPLSLVTPNPKHFDLYSKAAGIELTGRLPGQCDDPQFQFLCGYGMPNDRMSIVATLPGFSYGIEFKEFSIEFFGVEGSELPEIADVELKHFGIVEGKSFELTSTDNSLPGGYLTVEVPPKKFIVEFWRCRIFLNQSSLCLEMLWHGSVKGWGEHIISRPFETSAHYSRMAKAAALRDSVMAETRRGGDRNPKEIQELWNDSNCARFAQLVKELAPKWSWVKSCYDPQFSSLEVWISEVRDRTEFSAFFGRYKKLTNNLLLRVTSESLSEDDRAPIGLACMHAAHELGIADIYQKHGKPEPASSTLRSYYLRGMKLLQKQPSEQI